MTETWQVINKGKRNIIMVLPFRKAFLVTNPVSSLQRICLHLLPHLHPCRIPRPLVQIHCSVRTWTVQKLIIFSIATWHTNTLHNLASFQHSIRSSLTCTVLSHHPFLSSCSATYNDFWLQFRFHLSRLYDFCPLKDSLLYAKPVAFVIVFSI